LYRQNGCQCLDYNWFISDLSSIFQLPLPDPFGIESLDSYNKVTSDIPCCLETFKHLNSRLKYMLEVKSLKHWTMQVPSTTMGWVTHVYSHFHQFFSYIVTIKLIGREENHG
jgi:hypothetical protein